MRIALAIEQVRDAESELMDGLGRIGERHHADHDVFHMAETLVHLHHANLDALAPFAERYGTKVESGDADTGDAPLARAREKLAEMTGRRPDGGLLLLADLRQLHLLYAAASVNWVILEQGAAAARDQQLLNTVRGCHAQTLRGMKWSLTRLKTAAPQVLVN